MINIQSKRQEFEEKADDIRTKVADKLEAAAQSIRAAANDSASTLNDMADQAGKKLDTGAACVRSFAGRKTVGSLRSKVRDNPMRSLAAAAALGLVAGITWRAAR